MWTVGRGCNEIGRRPADRGRQAGRGRQTGRKGLRENEGDGGSWKANCYSVRTQNCAHSFGIICVKLKVQIIQFLNVITHCERKLELQSDFSQLLLIDLLWDDLP